METFKIEINGVRSNVNAQGYHSNHYVLKLPRNIEKLVFHCSASIASLVQISHSTVRPELSRPCVRVFIHKQMITVLIIRKITCSINITKNCHNKLTI